MIWGFAFLAVVAAFVDWCVVWKGKHQWRKYTKPLPLVLLLVVIAMSGPGYPFPIVLFVVGLLFGLLGDVLLLMQGRKAFILGLISFLVGHLFYIVGFNIEPVKQSIWMFIFLLPMGLAFWLLMKLILPHVKKPLRFPVWAYGFVLVMMSYSSLLTSLRSDWKTTGVVLSIFGGILFLTSDMMLAVDRFVRAKFGVWVMVTYHLAQMAIIAAVLSQYS